MAGTSSKRRRRNQRRCASDKQRREDERITTLLSSCREINNLCKTNPTKHTTIMEYLRKRASRFRNNGRIEGLELDKVLKELADEEETVTTGSESIEAEDSSLTEEQIEALIMEETECVQKALEMGLLQVHGTPPNTKGEGIFRLVGENSNGFNNNISGNEKLEKAVELRKELNADGALFVEHRLNLKHKDNKNNFKQMFQREDTVKAIAGHNIHEGVKKGVGREEEN